MVGTFTPPVPTPVTARQTAAVRYGRQAGEHHPHPGHQHPHTYYDAGAETRGQRSTQGRHDEVTKQVGRGENTGLGVAHAQAGLHGRDEHAVAEAPHAHCSELAQRTHRQNEPSVI